MAVVTDAAASGLAAPAGKVEPGRQRSPVGPFRHIAVATVVLGSAALAWGVQDRVKATIAPFHEAWEHTEAARVACFILLSAVPEPSPIVLGISAVMVWAPPVDAWRLLITAIEPWQFFVMICPALVFAVYWANGLLLLALELRWAPDLMQSYKIQRSRSFPTEKVGRVVGNILFNLGVVVPVIGLAMYQGHKSGIMPLRLAAEAPGPLEIATSILVYLMLNEVLFFYVHWFLHHRLIYGLIHKVHHEFKAPCALAAVYCHPVELVVADFIPLGFGPSLFCGHGYTLLLWCVYAVLGTQTHHCGFRWPWIPGHAQQPNFHDSHHERTTANFGGGLGSWLDQLHGTYEADAVRSKDQDAPPQKCE